MAKSTILGALMGKVANSGVAGTALGTAANTAPPAAPQEEAPAGAPDDMPPEIAEAPADIPELSDILGGLPTFPIEHFEGAQYGWDNAPEDAGQSSDVFDSIF